MDAVDHVLGQVPDPSCYRRLRRTANSTSVVSHSMIAALGADNQRKSVPASTAISANFFASASAGKAWEPPVSMAPRAGFATSICPHATTDHSTPLPPLESPIASFARDAHPPAESDCTSRLPRRGEALGELPHSGQVPSDCRPAPDS